MFLINFYNYYDKIIEIIYYFFNEAPGIMPQYPWHYQGIQASKQMWSPGLSEDL